MKNIFGEDYSGLIEALSAQSALGIFDISSITIKYNFSYYTEFVEQYKNNNFNLKLSKTITHETSHLFQTLTTPYGFYYKNLKKFQTQQVRTILYKLLHDYKIRLKYPVFDLLRLIDDKEIFSDLVRYFKVWFQAEALSVYFDGHFSSLENRVLNNPFVKDIPFIIHFLEIDHYLNIIMNVSEGNDIKYQNPMQNTLSEESVWSEYFNIYTKVLLEQDITMLLESWAVISEYFYLGEQKIEDFEFLFPIEYDKKRYKYFYCLNYAKKTIKCKTIKEFYCTFLAIAELSLFSPMLPNYSLLRKNDRLSINDISPFNRFMDACSAAINLPPITNFEKDYKGFITELCNILGWATPMQIAQETIDTFKFENGDKLSGLYYKSMLHRLKKPWTFIDYFGLAKEPNKDIIMEFSPCVTEFNDAQFFHNEPETANYFISHYIIDAFLRQIFISNNNTVRLPFYLEKEAIEHYRNKVKHWMFLDLNINADIRIESGNIGLKKH